MKYFYNSLLPTATFKQPAGFFLGLLLVVAVLHPPQSHPL